MRLEEFENYVSAHREDLCQMTGDCSKCPNKRKCHKCFKEDNIESLLKMEVGDSRFPLLLSLIKKNTWILKFVPTKLFC